METEARPLLRPNLRFVRHENDAGIAYVVKDPVRRKYFRFGQIEAWLMQQMDGTRTLQDICAELHGQIGVRAAPAALAVLVRRLRELGLVERSPRERSALLMEKLRTERKLKLEGENTLLRMRFSFGDPDRFLARAVGPLGFFFTRTFVLVSAASFVLYALLLSYQWQDFATAMAAVFSPSQVTVSVFLMSYVTFAGIGALHELGHGLTCKRFGGEVHEIGAMVLYFAPAFFCNISDAWTFEKRSHRLWVTFAGGWVQLWLSALAAFVWLLTEPGTVVNTMALFTAVVGGSLSLLLNYNPLIPLDGYYALVDWLELPNLRARSFDYVSSVVKRRVFRLQVEPRQVTDRERRIFLGYGIASGIYTTILLTIVAVFVGRFLTERFGGWGWAMFLLLLAVTTRQLRGSLLRFLRVFTAEKLPRSRRGRCALGSGIAALVLVGVSALVPWTVRTAGAALVEPAARHWLRAPEAARLTELRVREGDVVRSGDTLAVLRDPELELARSRALMLIRELEQRAAAARAAGDAANVRVAELAGDAERAQLALFDERRSALVLRAQVAGVVVTPRAEDRLGAVIPAGDSLLELWSGGALRARVHMPQRTGGEIAPGATMRVRFPAYPWWTWRTSIDRIEPAADHDIIAAAVLPAAPDQPLLPGMIGHARIDVAHTTVAGAVLRSLRRLIRLDLLL